MKQGLYFLFAIVPIFANAQLTLLFDNPPSSPALFAEGTISTPLRERDFALSPDGTEMFYSLQSPGGVFQTIIYRYKKQSGQWSEPTIASFAGKYSDLEPAFSPDGRKLFFASNRPVSGEKIKDFDIWYVEKINGRWTDAKNAGSPVNRENDEFYPSVTASGNLYFTAHYPGESQKEDIYISIYKNGKYQQPIVLDSSVNSTYYDFNAYVSPAEDVILFTSYGRKDDKGGGDLYASVKDKNGVWQPAVNLEEINSPKLDYCPFVSFDGAILFFTSERYDFPRQYTPRISYEQLVDRLSAPANGLGNIYWMSFTTLLNSIKNKLL